MSVGGWVTEEAYAKELLSCGADKIVVNSIVHSDPNLVSRLAEKFGTQCIVASIDFQLDEDRGNDVALIDKMEGV